jgi:hypothetical protein
MGTELARLSNNPRLTVQVECGWRPAWQLLPIQNHLVEDVHRASQNLSVRQLPLFPSGLCEDARGRESDPWVRHVVH